MSCKGCDDKNARQMPNMHVWLLFLILHGNKAMVLCGIVVACKNNIPCVGDWD